MSSLDNNITFGIFMKYVVTCATLVLIVKFAFDTIQVYIKAHGSKKDNDDSDDICGRSP